MRLAQNMGTVAPMAAPVDLMHGLLHGAIERTYGVDADPPIRPANPKYGDLGSPVGHLLAKQLGLPPAEIAASVASEVSDPRVMVSSAGPFISVEFDDEYLARLAEQIAEDPRLGCELADPSERIIIDYSSPNIAKVMHVGHLRSTIIGDSIARLHQFRGHHVIRQNHVGDWGTQFGMLVELIDERGEIPETLTELSAWYQESKQRFDDDPGFADRARDRVTALQAGDETARAYWQQLVDVSGRGMQRLYDRLGVQLTIDDMRGESAYNDELPDVVEQLLAAGVAQRDNGAIGIFDGPSPLLVEKSNGGYMYGTTDLAALRYRSEQLGAERVLYIVDARQRDHFEAMFAAAERMGWTGSARLEHVLFGSVLDPRTREPYKTRDGDAVSLESFIDAADEACAGSTRSRHPEWSEERVAEVGHALALGALKYADLSGQRGKDYLFNVERMIEPEGDTGPYLQYVYARTSSVARRATDEPGTIVIGHPAERRLVIEAAAFATAVRSAAESSSPHVLCGALRRIAQRYSDFYTQCPILKADDATRASRLSINQLVGRSIEQGLDLLGIPHPEQI